MSKNILRKIIPASALALLSIPGVWAFDLKVTVIDEVTGQKSGDISLTAHNPKDLSLLRSADFIAADTTFLFKDLPDREVLVMWPEGLDMHSAPARPDMEELKIQAKIEQETQLKEVVVQGLSHYMTDDGQVYIPSKKERKGAFDASSLLSILAIPTLDVSPLSTDVKTSAGEPVEIFINYMPARAEEVSGLRPMEIEKVEVLDYPKDPRFRGAKHVVNYILTEYSYGGFTRLYGSQSFFADVRNYSLFSKMRYRAMTYDVSGGYGYTDLTHAGSSSEEEYRLTDVTVVKRTEPERVHNVSHTPYALFKATYQGSSSAIANYVGLSYRDNPVKRQRSVTTYTPAVVAGDWEESNGSGSNLTLLWNGDWNWSLPRAYTLMILPSVTYGDIRSDAITTGSEYRIVNDARDKNWDLDLRGILSRQFGQQLLSVTLWGRHINDKIKYSGTSASDVNTRYSHVALTLTGNLRFGKFWGYATVQGAWSRSETNGIVSHDGLSPNYYVTIGYNPDQRTRVNLTSSLSIWTAERSKLTQDLFLQTPLFAITGNPYLKNSRFNEVNASCTRFLSGALSISADVGYNRYSNVITETYERSEYDGHGIILRGYSNLPHIDRLKYGVSLSGRFLSNSLSGTLRVGGEYADRNTTTKRSMNSLNYSVDLNWLHGDWNLMGGYSSADKGLTDTGWQKTPQYYYLGAGWSPGDWHLQLFVTCPFSNSWVYQKSWIESSVYNSRNTSYYFGEHRRIVLSASWSISYGKKIEPQQDTRKPEEASSAILH